MATLPATFLQNPQLRAAAASAPALRKGASGDGVRIVQQALLDLKFTLPVTTHHGTAPPDGVFGDETDRAVRSFQLKSGIVADGAVGERTLVRLAEQLGSVRRSCAQPFTPVPHRPAALTAASFRPAGRASGTAAAVQLASFSLPKLPVTIPTSLRFLTASELGSVSAIFGSSLDFGRILVSNGAGFSKRPFTTVGPLPGFITLNLGGSFSTSTLIHELTHAWQSQHHPVDFQFMVNAVESQALAVALGEDAYKYTAGKAFGFYGAEQIAQQVEDGITAIIAHIKGATVGLPDAGNMISLSVPRCE